MDANRVISIVLSDMVLDNLKVQESIERIINSDADINSKVIDIKAQLSRFVLNDLMMSKFKEMIPKQENELNHG